MNFSTIQAEYTRVWRVFTDAAAEQGLGAESRSSVGAKVVRNETTGVVSAESLLLLSDWPFKVVSKKMSKNVDIVVQAVEVFSVELTRIVKSTTQVGYFARAGDARVPLLELHYDFEAPVQEAHPVFHAQLGATKWPVEQIQELGTFGTITRDGVERSYGNSKIPTAFMGFVPVLVTLAADHLRPRGYRQMVACARETQVSEPQCERMLRTLPCVPHSHHWYDDRFVAYEWTEKKIAKATVPVLGEEIHEQDQAAARRALLKKLNLTLDRLEFRSGPPPG